MDVWVVRYNEEAPLWYWGFKQLPEAESARIAGAAQALLFLDGPVPGPGKGNQVILLGVPQLPASKMLQVVGHCVCGHAHAWHMHLCSPNSHPVAHGHQ